jgi:hypothetical protein
MRPVFAAACIGSVTIEDLFRLMPRRVLRRSIHVTVAGVLSSPEGGIELWAELDCTNMGVIQGAFSGVLRSEPFELDALPSGAKAPPVREAEPTETCAPSPAPELRSTPEAKGESPPRPDR